MDPVQKVPSGLIAATERVNQIERQFASASQPQFATVLQNQIAGGRGAEGEAEKREDRKLAALREAARGMEALFLNHLLTRMRSTVGESGLFGNGPAAKIYEGMFDENLSKVLSKAGGIGLADMIYAQMKDHLTAAEED